MRENDNVSLKVFGYESSAVRVSEDESGIWFCAKDVAVCLAHSNPTRMIEVCDEGETNLRLVPNARGENRETPFVSEFGLYRILMRSDLPTARPFQDWLVKQVLPSIRRTGRYEAPKANPLSDLKMLEKQVTLAKEYLRAAKAGGVPTKEVQRNVRVILGSEATTAEPKPQEPPRPDHSRSRDRNH